MNVIIREPLPKDVRSLHQLVLDSTDGQSKITEASLYEDLFNSNLQTGKLEKKCNDKSVEFEPGLVKSDTPPVGAFVAEVQDELIGYVLYRYHYSPWTGRAIFIVDTFVALDHRGKHVARQLVGKVISRGRQEGLPQLIFSIRHFQSSLRSYLLKNHKLEWYRNDEKDWSVYRLNC